jgi:hypothetical protein
MNPGKSAILPCFSGFFIGFEGIGGRLPFRSISVGFRPVCSAVAARCTGFESFLGPVFSCAAPELVTFNTGETAARVM